MVVSTKFPGIRSTWWRYGRRAEIGTYKRVGEEGTKVEVCMIIESCTVYIVLIRLHINAHNTICMACLAVICTAGNHICQFKTS